jgi:hypothetical protein
MVRDGTSDNKGVISILEDGSREIIYQRVKENVGFGPESRSLSLCVSLISLTERKNARTLKIFCRVNLMDFLVCLFLLSIPFI